jgi:predicted metal-binding protein
MITGFCGGCFDMFHKNEICYAETVKQLKEDFPDFNIVGINPSCLIFEERVRLNCFYCNKYGHNWKCPPRIPEIDYKKLVTEYYRACFVYKIYPINSESYPSIRIESTILLHKTLLEMEKILFEESNGLCLSFIGGSCKLCKGGCGLECCNNPYSARMPLEAIGVNIVDSAKRYNINIEFPVKENLIRLGLILW